MTIPFEEVIKIPGFLKPTDLPAMPEPAKLEPKKPRIKPTPVPRPKPSDIEWPIFQPESVSPSGIRRFTPEQKREMIEIYTQLPHGYKRAFLTANGVDTSNLRQWSHMLGNFANLPYAFVKGHRFGIKRTTPVEDVSTLTSAEKRDLALGFMAQHHGQRCKFIEFYQVSEFILRKWCSALADGDLDNEVYPRFVGKITPDNANEITRLRHAADQLNESLFAMEEDYKKKVAKLEKELAKTREELRQQKVIADVLGKAIAKMPTFGEESDAVENT